MMHRSLARAVRPKTTIGISRSGFYMSGKNSSLPKAEQITALRILLADKFPSAQFNRAASPPRGTDAPHNPGGSHEEVTSSTGPASSDSNADAGPVRLPILGRVGVE